MFLGVIVVCANSTIAINEENCIPMTSPTHFATKDICYQATGNTILSDPFQDALKRSNSYIYNAKCVDLLKKDEGEFKIPPLGVPT